MNGVNLLTDSTRKESVNPDSTRKEYHPYGQYPTGLASRPSDHSIFLEHFRNYIDVARI